VHEFSLAQGLYSQLLQLAEQHQAIKIAIVRVDIGSLSGIVIDSFSFGFEVLAAENTLTKKAVLEISVIDPVYICLDCDTTLQTDLAPSTCSGCGAKHLIRERGEELILTQVEMEQA
jgi:hydrogenase nickel insertion protein HypA